MSQFPSCGAEPARLISARASCQEPHDPQHLVDQINAAGRVPFGRPASPNDADSPESKLADALNRYSSTLLNDLGAMLSPEQEALITMSIAELKTRSATVSDQTSAFSVLTKQVLTMTGGEVAQAKALDLRTAAREEAGLSLFPPATALAHVAPTAPKSLGDSDPRLLDVDFVAIYW